MILITEIDELEQVKKIKKLQVTWCLRWGKSFECSMGGDGRDVNAQLFRHR